jgi:hypothetical protein
MRTKSNQLHLAALAEREWLREFVQSAQGDPRLTAEEEHFVAHMRQFVEQIDRYAGVSDDWRLSHKQAEYVRRILAKIDSKPEDGEEDSHC